jgi:hypothetical protein
MRFHGAERGVGQPEREGDQNYLRQAYAIFSRREPDMAEQLSALRQIIQTKKPKFSPRQQDFMGLIFQWSMYFNQRGGLSQEDREFIQRQEGEIEGKDEQLNALKHLQDRVVEEAKILGVV